MKNNKSSLLTAVLRVPAHAPLLTAGLVLTVAGAVVFSLWPPLVLERIVNALAEGTDVAFSLALAYFGVLALSGLFDAGKEMLITRFGQKITRSVRHTMCAKLSRLPASFFSAADPGVTVSRFVNDVDTVDTLFASGVIGMFADACKVIGILAVIFYKSVGLGLLMLVATPLLFLFTRHVQRHMLTAQMQYRAAVGRLNSHVPETIRNIRMLHVFSREAYMSDKYDDRIGESYNAVEKVNFYDAIYSPVILVISAVIIAVMMVLAATGGTMQTFFGMSVGTAVAVIAFVGKVFDPLESIGMEIQSIQSALAGVRRIREFLDEPERRIPNPALRAEELLSGGAPAVEIADVTFGYSEETTVLRNLSFTVGRGESVTLVGRTGAGKSTLFKLLLGYYLPQHGNVRIYGVDAAEIPDSEKRHLFGYVEQTFRPVPGTVFDQIAVFAEDISPEAVRRAAALAGIDAVISALPQGYDTPYTPDLFSQGQRQLLSVARAVAGDPAILLLDEITANLDAETEKQVLLALRNASRSRTVLSISHRLYEQVSGRVVTL